MVLGEGGVTQLCKQFYMMVLGGDHSTMWTILYDGAWGGDHSPTWTIFLWFQDHLRHWIETSVQSTKLSHKHFSDKIPLWSFCAYVRFYRIIIFCYKTTFWFLRFETFWDLQNFLSLPHVKTSWLVMSYLGLAQFFSIYISFCF